MQGIFRRAIAGRNAEYWKRFYFSQLFQSEASLPQKRKEHLSPSKFRYNSPYQFRRNFGSEQLRRSFFGGREELSIEEEAERKIGWLFKLLFIGTASIVAYQFVPYMGGHVMQQSVALLRVKDPLFKRMGASRLCRFATDDERRMQIIELGGAHELLKMLDTAKDDRTRKEALKALIALSESDVAAETLHLAGVSSVLRSIPNSTEDAEVMNYKSRLLQRFQDLQYDITS